MRQAFTLIELMIVIAIIAIIAAIAIPNLLESRITANESAAAASLKSGIFAGQVQFTSGAYSDMDSDGRGEYATDVKWLAGVTSGTTIGTNLTTRAITLISPTYQVGDGSTVGAYRYQIDTDTTAFISAATSGEAGDLSNAESFWAGYAAPGTAGSDGRRAFGISTSGVVFSTKPTAADANLTLAGIVNGGAIAIFSSNPISSNPTNTANAVPYQK